MPRRQPKSIRRASSVLLRARLIVGGRQQVVGGWPGDDPPQALEDLTRIGTERQLAEHPIELGGCNPRVPRHLALLGAHRAVPSGLVHAAPGLAMGPAIAMLEEKSQVHAIDAEFLGDLAPGALVVGFSRGADAAGEHVVGAWEDVLGVRATVDQDL